MNNVELRIVTDFTAREEKKAKMIKLREVSYNNVEEKYNSFKNEDLQRRIASQTEVNMNHEIKSFDVSYVACENLDYINFLKFDDNSIEKVAHRAIKIRSSRTENINKIYVMATTVNENASDESVDTAPYQVYKNSDTNINFDKYSIFEKNEDENQSNEVVVSPEVVEIPKVVEQETVVGEAEERIMPQIMPEREEERVFAVDLVSIPEVKENTEESNKLSQEDSGNAANSNIDDLKEMLARAQSLRDGVLAAKQQRESAENSANAAKEKLSDTTKMFESYCEDLEAQKRKEEAEAERLKTETEQYQATINDMLEVMGTTQA